MQSSKFRAGLQWNIPVESYFISVFSKSKSFDWSSAIPAGIDTPLPCCVPDPPPRLVGLYPKKNIHRLACFVWKMKKFALVLDVTTIKCIGAKVFINSLRILYFSLFEIHAVEMSWNETFLIQTQIENKKNLQPKEKKLIKFKCSLNKSISYEQWIFFCWNKANFHSIKKHLQFIIEPFLIYELKEDTEHTLSKCLHFEWFDWKFSQFIRNYV